MKTLSILLFATLVQAQIFAQESDIFKLWPDSVLAKANTAQNVSFMTDEEKEAIYYMNLCRLNPKLFSSTFLSDYLKDNDIKKDKEVKELIKYLEETPDMQLLYPKEDLTSAARKHAKDMGTTGRTGHSSSDGTSFSDRLSYFKETYGGINENANYGFDDGLDIVIDLLIDRGVSNAGHRKNILDRDMSFVGVAIEPHKRYRFNCVQIFGAKKAEQ